MAEVLKMRFLVRSRTASEWTALNEVLLASTSGTGAREMGIEEDTGRVKLGDGVTAWNALSYQPNGGLPPGGTIGQVLTKKSATDGDADWQDPSGGIGGHRLWRIYMTANTGANDFLNLQEIQYVDSHGQDMTTPAGGYATASSAFSGNPASACFDRNFASGGWGSGDNTKPQWVAYQFASPAQPAAVRLWPNNYQPTVRPPGALKVQYSDDGVTWTDAGSWSGVTGWTFGTAKTFTL